MIKNITLYRPTGANELELIIDSGMKRFPPRLFWQPIFYPVLNMQYAIDIAEGWNMRDAESDGVGFVTAFEIPEDYFNKFEVQTVGLTHHQELWYQRSNWTSSTIRSLKEFVLRRHLLEENLALRKSFAKYFL